MKSANVEYAFRYSGPIQPEPHPRCVTCDATRKKECPTHGTSFTKGCAHCDAAQGGPCQAHWGLKAAMDHHPVPDDVRMAADQAEIFAKVQQEIVDLSEPNTKSVDLHLRGSIICLDNGGVRREHVVDLTIR